MLNKITDAISPNLFDEDDDYTPILDNEGLVANGFYYTIKDEYKYVYRINSGNIDLKYVFPNCLMPSLSKMINWRNLFFVDNFDMDDLLVESVIKGLKPIGFVYYTKDKNNLLNIFDHLSTTTNLILTLLGDWESADGQVYLGIANNCKLADLFDIDTVIDGYRNLSSMDGFSISQYFDIDYLHNLMNMNMGWFLESANWDHGNPTGFNDVIINGLLLGYPIESTYAYFFGGVENGYSYETCEYEDIEL